MFVFEHIPKTAGTTLKFILRNNFGMYHCDANLTKKDPFTKKELRLAKKIFPSIKSISGHNLKETTTHLNDKDHLHITVLREPVKRCLSHFQDNCLRHGNTLPFEEWILMDRVQNLQVKHITGEENLEKAKKILKEKFFFVGLTERFDESLQLFKAISPCKVNINYKKKVVASNNTIKNELLKEPDKVELAKKYNQLDLELYQFVKEELFTQKMNENAELIEQTEKPREKYKSVLTLNYQMSVFYNKFIYKILLKLLGERK